MYCDPPIILALLFQDPAFAMAQTITQSSDETVQTFRCAPGLLSAMIIVAQCAVENWGHIMVNLVEKWSGGDLFPLYCAILYPI